jgi:hypothetical protein
MIFRIFLKKTEKIYITLILKSIYIKMNFKDINYNLKNIICHLRFRDYEERPELDNYDSDNIDDEEHEELDLTLRRNIERMMDERDTRGNERTAADYLLDSTNYINIFLWYDFKITYVFI